jgi:hypothetical protein
MNKLTLVAFPPTESIRIVSLLVVYTRECKAIPVDTVGVDIDIDILVP